MALLFHIVLLSLLVAGVLVALAAVFPFDHRINR
jgi:hypothetical protein